MTRLRTANFKLFISLCLCLNAIVSFGQSNHQELTDSASVAEKKLDYQHALSFMEEALIISKKNNQTPLIVSDLLTIGELHLSLNDMDKAFESYITALPLAEKIKTSDSLEFETLRKISFYFMEFEDLELAEEYLDRAKKLADINENPSYYRPYYLCLGILERRKKNYKASVQAYKKALELTPDSMGLKKILTLNNISAAYSKAGQKELSLAHLLRAEELNKTVKDEWFDLVLPGQIGHSYATLGDYHKAINYYLLTLKKAEKVNNTRMLRRVNSALANVHYELGNYKDAYDYKTKFVVMLQSSHTKENASAIAEMSAKYEHEKNEQKIESLEKQKELKAQIHKSQIDRRNLWIIVSLLFVCLTILVAFILLKNQRNKQRLKLELAEKQKELAKQQAELKGEEIERNRLSRELHDGLGGTLASIKMRLSSKNIEELSPILNDIDAACQDVRNMSHSLSSSFINETNFYALLMKLTKDIRHRSSLIVNLEFMPLEELNSLEPEIIHQCYRIIQELTNNVLKYAQAKTLTIGLMKNDDEVILLIEDDGVGFDTSSTPSGIGLNNVRKRLENINGHLEITSRQNEGSTFSINFPFKSTYEN